MIVALPFPATFDDLMKVEGKAELINGRIVEQMASGDLPCDVAANILVDLRLFLKANKCGRAFGDNLGYTLAAPLLSLRESFSPDVSFTDIPRTTKSMKFVQGPPKFAVEVRSEYDYGRAAEIAMAAKWDDYFEAGTLVVWDVDPIARTVTKYTPTSKAAFTGNVAADAEPAVPGWTMNLDDVFAES